MAFRLLLLLTFATGLYLYIEIPNKEGLYHAKITAGLLTLIFGELTLVRVKRVKPIPVSSSDSSCSFLSQYSLGIRSHTV